MTGLVPALAGHVELELERRLVRTLAGVEVPARAARALKRLDLAHEDAVHQLAGRVRRVGVGRLERVALRAVVAHGVAGIEDDFLDVDALEPRVAGQLLDRKDPLHRTKASSWGSERSLDGVDDLIACQPGRGRRRQRSVAAKLLDGRHRMGIGEGALIAVVRGPARDVDSPP